MISTKGRYALRVMLDLAMQNSEEFVPLKAIAQRQNISLKYLEAILKTLVAKNLLYGLSGRGGGYKLTRLPSEYTVGEIVECAEGTLAPVSCLEEGSPECSKKGSCRTLPMWEKLDTLIHDFLYGITLGDLMKDEPLK